MQTIELQEPEQTTALDIIDSQLNVITNAIEWPDDIYDTMNEDKVKIVSAALRIIHAVQWEMIKSMHLTKSTRNGKGPN